jgi:hypothetical protein
VLQVNVSAKRFVQHFTGFSQSTRAVGHGLFDADDFMALRALAEAMTRAIHFVLWPKPSHVGQFWPFHASSFPQFANLTRLWIPKLILYQTFGGPRAGGFQNRKPFRAITLIGQNTPSPDGLIAIL